jgi:hypothetical protein
MLCGVRTFLRRIESARDHLMLFGAIIVALAVLHVKRSTDSNLRPI